MNFEESRVAAHCACAMFMKVRQMGKWTDVMRSGVPGSEIVPHCY